MNTFKIKLITIEKNKIFIELICKILTIQKNYTQKLKKLIINERVIKDFLKENIQIPLFLLDYLTKKYNLPKEKI